MSTHTPGPWEVVRDIEAGQWLARHSEDCGYPSLDDAKEEVARLNAIEAHRVNSHDALLAACEAARNSLGFPARSPELAEQLNAAIKLGKGQG